MVGACETRTRLVQYLLLTFPLLPYVLVQRPDVRAFVTLDIWKRGPSPVAKDVKVLGVIWNDGGSVVVIYLPGAWEQGLRRLAGRQTDGAHQAASNVR